MDKTSQFVANPGQSVAFCRKMSQNVAVLINHTLYGMVVRHAAIKGDRRDLNPQYSEPQSDALAICATATVQIS